MGIASANSNSKIEDERKAAEKAKALLIGLTPAGARTDRIISVLRTAANMAATASLTRLERKKALDELRSDAAKSSIRYAGYWIAAPYPRSSGRSKQGHCVLAERPPILIE